MFSHLLSICDKISPLTKELSKYVDLVISQILKKFSYCRMSNFYGDVLSMLLSRREFRHYLLNGEVLSSLTAYIVDPMFAISSVALSLFTKIIFSQGKIVHLAVSGLNLRICIDCRNVLSSAILKN